MDIFFEELSYEQIEQQVAFGFPSLLSEIGGLLGLLLGASVLTVCELVDYLVLSLASKVERKNGPVRINVQEKQKDKIETIR